MFEDEAGQDLRPAKGRTWSPRGRTPVLRVTGKGSGRVLMAGMVCVKPGRETRLIYRTQLYRGRTGEKKGFRAREFADLLTTARRQLGGAPLIVVWDNASTHHSRALRKFCDRNSDWLTIVRLPPYAPDLNPVEGVWAHLKKPCTAIDRGPRPAGEEPTPSASETNPRPQRLRRRDRADAGTSIVRHPSLSTSASTTAVTPRKSPVRTNLTGLQVCYCYPTQ
ncbi:transposase [Streptomyces sp. ISL-66]|uniref:transposase n=1 Tax=Streptomyces sp. ISL-66 TaxID=2819186 RepID=UPI0027E40D6F|nr:transposase [Streptomyces sp. ISL-66]